MRLGQLCPSCAGLRQNQENHKVPLAATQTDSIITLMLSSLEIQDLPGSEGSRTKLKEYFHESCVPRPLEMEDVYYILESLGVQFSGEF